VDPTKLAAELFRDEDCKLKPYRDPVGKLTIGIGRNLDDVGISREEAEHLLHNDIAEVILDLDRALPWWRSLDEVRQRVLANMAFNMGIVKLGTFKNTLRFIQAGRYLEAAQAMLDSKWARQVGPRAERLAVMMRDGGP
jgi:lysozyme